MKRKIYLLLFIFILYGCKEQPKLVKDVQQDEKKVIFKDVTTDYKSVGRFQVYFSPIMRADTFLVDTQTGKVWKHVQTAQGGFIWEEMEKSK